MGRRYIIDAIACFYIISAMEKNVFSHHRWFWHRRSPQVARVGRQCQNRRRCEKHFFHRRNDVKASNCIDYVASLVSFLLIQINRIRTCFNFSFSTFRLFCTLSYIPVLGINSDLPQTPAYIPRKVITRWGRWGPQESHHPHARIRLTTTGLYQSTRRGRWGRCRTTRQSSSRW